MDDRQAEHVLRFIHDERCHAMVGLPVSRQDEGEIRVHPLTRNGLQISAVINPWAQAQYPVLAPYTIMGYPVIVDASLPEDVVVFRRESVLRLGASDKGDSNGEA